MPLSPGPVEFVADSVFDLGPEDPEFEGFISESALELEAADSQMDESLAPIVALAQTDIRAALGEDLDVVAADLENLGAAPVGPDLADAFLAAGEVDQQLIDAFAITPAEAWVPVPAPFLPPPEGTGFQPEPGPGPFPVA